MTSHHQAVPFGDESTAMNMRRGEPKSFAAVCESQEVSDDEDDELVVAGSAFVAALP